jgi:FkbM family methyltransferase
MGVGKRARSALLATKALMLRFALGKSSRRMSLQTPEPDRHLSEVNVIEVSDGFYLYRFHASTELERWRAQTLPTKEAGTIEWIHDAVRAGDVFVDVGANIGQYSLVAGRRVGDRGAVYSFEPHAANFLSLLRNVSLNNLGGVITPLGCALHEAAGHFRFNYRHWDAGTSMSQLGLVRDAEDRSFAPVIVELKAAFTLDELVATGTIRKPDHIKIDVDGNELLVLKGMRSLLTRADPPRTLQVEINSRYRQELFGFMAEVGFVQYHRHYTMWGKEQLRRGHDPESVVYNALFRPSG